MTIFDASQLEKQANHLIGQIYTPDLTKKLAGVADEMKSLTKPLAGKLEGELNNGLLALTATIRDFPEPDISAKLAITLKNGSTIAQNLQNVLPELQKPIGELTNQISGLASKITPEISAAQATLAKNITSSKISGTSIAAAKNVATAFNQMPVLLNNAKHMAATLDKVGVNINLQLNNNEIKGALETTLGNFDNILKLKLPEIKNFKLPDISSEIIGLTSKLSDLNGLLNTNLNSALKNITGLPVTDVLHDMNQSLSIVQSALKLPDNLASSALAATQVLNTLNTQNIQGAINLLQANPALQINANFSLNGLESKLLDLHRQLGDVTKMFSLVAPSIGAQIKISNTINTLESLSGAFAFINSFEELAAELANLKRNISTGVIHWSETTTDQNPGAQDIQRSAGTVEYHYIIKRDGTIQRGKAIEQKANHASGYDDESISILIIAGFSGINGDPGDLSEVSLTREQSASLKKLLAKIYDEYPGIEIWGHAEIDDTVSPVEPGLSVSDFIKSHFGKTNARPAEVYKGPPAADLGKPTGVGRVSYAYTPEASGGTVRNGYIQKDLMSILEQCSAETGTEISIFSGGQMEYSKRIALGAVRNEEDEWVTPSGQKVGVGSVRHDNGWAADISVKLNGKALNFGTNNPSSDALRVARKFKSLGITGMGAGPNYMSGNLHVDIAYGRNGANSASHWGKRGTTPPAWLTNIMG